MRKISTKLKLYAISYTADGTRKLKSSAVLSVMAHWLLLNKRDTAFSWTVSVLLSGGDLW